MEAKANVRLGGHPSGEKSKSKKEIFWNTYRGGWTSDRELFAGTPVIGGGANTAGLGCELATERTWEGGEKKTGVGEKNVLVVVPNFSSETSHNAKIRTPNWHRMGVKGQKRSLFKKVFCLGN